MKLLNKKYLLYIYFLFQCLMIFINFGLFIIVTVTNTQPNQLDFGFYFDVITLPIVISQIYFLITLISTIATWKYMYNKQITQSEKLFEIAFPIITILVYSIIVTYIF